MRAVGDQTVRRNGQGARAVIVITAIVIVIVAVVEIAVIDVAIAAVVVGLFLRLASGVHGRRRRRSVDLVG